MLPGQLCYYMALNRRFRHGTDMWKRSGSPVFLIKPLKMTSNSLTQWPLTWLVRFSDGVESEAYSVELTRWIPKG